MDKSVVREILKQRRKLEEPCPDDNELAYFIDGKASGAKRQEILDHFGDCEECYQVYAETMRTRQGLKQREGNWRRRAFKVAAPFALAAGIALIFFSRVPDTPHGSIQTAQTTRPAVPIAQAVGQLYTPGKAQLLLESMGEVSQVRFAFSATNDGKTLSFQIGLLLVDLHLALLSEDAPRFEHVIAQLLESADSSDELKELSSRCRQVQQTFVTSGIKSVDLQVIEDSLHGFNDDLLYLFGVWTEVARLALAVGQSHPLKLGELDVWQQELAAYDLPPGVGKSLQKIRVIINGQEWPDSGGLVEVGNSLNLIQQLMH